MRVIDLGGLSTEGRNPETMDLDTMSSLEIVEVMNREDARAVASVTGMLPRVAQAADWAIEAISSGGRLIYVGAGTSGRLGVLDAVECPPTFGVSPDVVVGLIAGGEDAFVKAVEGAEDDMALCVDDLKEIDLKPRDVVIGLAASGRTPYVIGGFGMRASSDARPLQSPATGTPKSGARPTSQSSLCRVQKYLRAPPDSRRARCRS